MFNTVMYYTGPLFKYTSTKSAKIILESQSLRLSRATEFNDAYDMLVINQYTPSTLGNKLEHGLMDFINYLTDPEDVRVSTFPILKFLKNKLLKVSNEELVKLKTEFLSEKIEGIYDLSKMFESSKRYTKEFQEIAYKSAVICFSTDYSESLMWSHYADSNNGIVIEFKPSVEKDSWLLVSKDIEYVDSPPSLEVEFENFFLSKEELQAQFDQKIIYTKAKKWAYEKEKRIAIYGDVSEQNPFKTYGFHSEELVSITFGLRTPAIDKLEIETTAKKVNKHIRFYQIEQNKDFSLKRSLVT